MHKRIEAAHLDPTQLPTSEVNSRTEAHLVEPVLAAIQAAVADSSVTAAQVFAGVAYGRKGETRTTAFGEKPNPSYSSEDDDFYLQIGVRVPRYAAGPVLDAIKVVETLSNEQKLREIQAQLAEAKERTASAQRTEERLQAQVEELIPHLGKEN